ncbi:hypothetical protein HMPREF1989_00510 [Porphyromonas gingivalis F0566]|nr:hypothetical protein HMPREF1989_00510 [Porphyromonas gingivalis F0566]
MDPERKGKGYEVSCETSRWRPCIGCNRLLISRLQMQIGGVKCLYSAFRQLLRGYRQ